MNVMRIAAGVLIAGSGVVLSSSLAQQMEQNPGVTRTDLQRHDLGIPGHEVIQTRVDFAPGAAFPLHRHPGEEIIYVIEGSIEYRVEDQPPVIVNAGGVLFIPDGTGHTASNAGNVNAAELGTYVVKKGEPLVELVK